jgi:hypothetical protein
VRPPLLTGLIAATVLLATALSPPQRSGANFAAKKTNAANAATADMPFNYLHLYSQSTDPAGLVNYATKRLATPVELAATGTDQTLSVALGNRRGGGAVNRIFTLQTPAAFPAGVTQITVALNVVSAPWNFNSNIATVNTIAGGNNTNNGGGTSTVTLAANQKRQVNIAVPALAGLGVLFVATIDLKITYPGYAGSYLSYSIPLTAWDGAGGGP